MIWAMKFDQINDYESVYLREVLTRILADSFRKYCRVAKMGLKHSHFIKKKNIGIGIR